MGHPVNPLKVIFLVIITEKFKKNIELMKNLILHNDTVSLTIYISYTLPILTLFKSNHTLFQSFTLPIFHSSNLTLLQSYTLSILHSSFLHYSDQIFYQCYTLPILYTLSILRSFNHSLFQYYTLPIFNLTLFNLALFQSCT